MTTHNHEGNDQTLFHRIAAGFAHYWRSAQVRSRVRYERQLLSTLDDRTLKDIGITRADAHFEANRPSWDIPEYRLPRTTDRTRRASTLAQISGHC